MRHLKNLCPAVFVNDSGKSNLCFCSGNGESGGYSGSNTEWENQIGRGASNFLQRSASRFPHKQAGLF
jgi:hypothetical protein